MGRLDCLLWFCVPLGIIFLTGVGAVSGDAIFHSLEIELGTWYLNPNHLLFDPLGVFWSQLFSRFGPEGVSLPDQLCVLSVLSGALSIALLRMFLGCGAIKLRRSTANWATLAFASCSAFQRLMVSGEFFMVLMPFFVAGVFFLLEAVERRSWLFAFAAGATIGFSSLFMISQLLNAGLLGVVLAVWLFPKLPLSNWLKIILAYGAGLLVFTLIPLLIAWSFSSHATSDFLSWMMSYRGKSGNSDNLGYGAQVHLKAILTAAARALYGQFCSLIDLSPLRDVASKQIPFSALEGLRIVASSLIVFLCLAIPYFRSPSQNQKSFPGLAILAILAATVFFGTAWDNSDDQFFFHTSICLALVVGMSFDRSPKCWTLLLLTLFVFNLFDLGTRTLTYDRTGKVFELIGITNDASVIIVPGADELETLTYFLPNKRSKKFLSIEALPTIKKFPEGMSFIESEVAQALDAHERVVIVNIIDSSEEKVPWKRLQKVGYGLKEVTQAFSVFETGPLNSTPSGISWRSVVGIKSKVIDKEPPHQKPLHQESQSGSL